MTRRCRLCDRSIEGYPSAARYCKESGCLKRRYALRKEHHRSRDRAYMRRKRAEQNAAMLELRGKGLRFCRCGVDISHRPIDFTYCETCSQNRWKLNQHDALRRELHQLHEMNPERWPVEVLAARYQLPVHMVQEAVTT